MKTLLALLICMSSNFLYAADSREGYWSNTRILSTYEDGNTEKSLQTKELVQVNADKNEFTVKITQVSEDGGYNEYESLESDFITPEDGAEIVKNCSATGGVLGVQSVLGKRLDTCTIKAEEDSDTELTFAAVPFGLYSIKYSFQVELPGGQTTTIRMSETLTGFGKN